MVKIFNGFRDVVSWRLQTIKLNTSAVIVSVKIGFIELCLSIHRFLITVGVIRVLSKIRGIKISTSSGSRLGKVGLLLSLESF